MSKHRSVLPAHLVHVKAPPAWGPRTASVRDLLDTRQVEMAAYSETEFRIGSALLVTSFEQTLNESSRESTLGEIGARIREYDVKHVYLQYVSVQGRVLGKVLPARHFD